MTRRKGGRQNEDQFGRRFRGSVREVALAQCWSGFIVRGMNAPVYPFEPKSNARLRPGQFWGIRLSKAQWACGRVLALPPAGQPGSRAVFLVGLMDWLGEDPPTNESIAAGALLVQALNHYKTITLSGTPILDIRDLSADGLRHTLWREALFGDSDVLDFMTPVRRATEEDKRNLPSQVIWQGDYIRIFAERHLVRREPMPFDVARVNPSQP